MLIIEYSAISFKFRRKVEVVEHQNTFLLVRSNLRPVFLESSRSEIPKKLQPRHYNLSLNVSDSTSRHIKYCTAHPINIWTPSHQDWACVSARSATKEFFQCTAACVQSIELPENHLKFVRPVRPQLELNNLPRKSRWKPRFYFLLRFFLLPLLLPAKYCHDKTGQ